MQGYRRICNHASSTLTTAMTTSFNTEPHACTCAAHARASTSAAASDHCCGGSCRTLHSVVNNFDRNLVMHLLFELRCESEFIAIAAPAAHCACKVRCVPVALVWLLKLVACGGLYQTAWPSAPSSSHVDCLNAASTTGRGGHHSHYHLAVTAAVLGVAPDRLVSGPLHCTCSCSCCWIAVSVQSLDQPSISCTR